MTLRFSTVLMLGGAAMLASCSTGQLQETRSPKAQKELAEALAGRNRRPTGALHPQLSDQPDAGH